MLMLKRNVFAQENVGMNILKEKREILDSLIIH